MYFIVTTALLFIHLEFSNGNGVDINQQNSFGSNVQQRNMGPNIQQGHVGQNFQQTYSRPGIQQNNPGPTFYKTGDARACLEVARRANLPMRRFSALPGIGWDNLRNVAAGQVTKYNYSMCRTTEDGRYLIPDAIFTIPIKKSYVETFAEIFESWNNVTSTTSRGINADAGLDLSSVSISGSFSYEHSRMKTNLIRDDSALTRVQLRFTRYDAKLQPDSELYPNFRLRVLAIASDLTQNLTQSAQYKSQILVRDYGTHVLTSVTAGAVLAKSDFVKRSYVESHDSDKTKIAAAANAEFGTVFHISASAESSSSKSEDSAYKKSMTHSYITTHGGPLIRPYNMTANEWVNGVDMELVPVDRRGDPLHFVITENVFPELPSPLVDRVARYVRQAIAEYYEMNTIKGCTKRGTPNFSFSANVDDGSCVITKRNLTFGGVYQKCAVTQSFYHTNPCNGLNQLNPLTQGYSCPSGYIEVKLHSGKKLGKRESSKECRSCGILWLSSCCHYNYKQGIAQYTMYWCAAQGTIKDDSGYLFGGIYSSSLTNLVTGAKTCPPMFYPLHIFQDHRICLSSDYELGGVSAVPFGGFTSCTVGNPLAVERKGNEDKNTLRYFMESSSKWPMQCPKGYSQHLAAVDDGCAIRYCVRTGALTNAVFTPIKRPPFFTKPESISQTNIYVMLSKVNSFEDGFKRMTKTEYTEGAKIQPISRQPSLSSSTGQSLRSDSLTGIIFMISLLHMHFGE